MSSTGRKSGGTHARDGYEPLDLIGKGSFGKIRRVRRKSDGKIFARKELEYEKMGEQDKKQLVAEVNILRVMSHANIVKYEDRFVDVDDKILYIIMEYCDGGDLGGLIKKCRKTNTLLPEETVWSYLAQMTSGLHACHNRMVQPEEPSTGLPSAHSTSNIVSVTNRRGNVITSGSSASSLNTLAAQRSVILHRDLKPENVFLDGDQRVKLGDFGLSKEMQTDFTATYVGTPYYMSPELSEGKRYDTKSDIWALGCIAYELCALSPPFDAKTQEELTRKIRLGKVPRLPTAYSEGLGHIINSMLQLEPRRRPSTTDMLAHPMVEVQLRSLELLDMRSLVIAEKVRLEAWEGELKAREEKVQALEQSLATTRPISQSVNSPDAATLAVREAHIASREAYVQAYEAELQARTKDLEVAQAQLEEQKSHLEQELARRSAEGEQKRRGTALLVEQRQIRRTLSRRSPVGASSVEDGQERVSLRSSNSLQSTMTARRRRSPGTDASTSASSGYSGSRPPAVQSTIQRTSSTSIGRSEAGVVNNRFGQISPPTDDALGHKHGTEQHASKGDWVDQDDRSDAGELQTVGNSAPVESTPLRASASTRPLFRVGGKKQQLFRETIADDSDIPMNSFEHSRGGGSADKDSVSILPTTKSFPSMASGRSLAHLAAMNAAGIIRPPLVARLSSVHNISLQDISMKSASGEDRSLGLPGAKVQAQSHTSPISETASPALYSDDSLPSVFIDKVVRPSSAKRVSDVKAHGAVRSCVADALKKVDDKQPGTHGRPSDAIHASRAVTGRPRSSAVMQPISSTRRKSAVRPAAAAA